ncbi:hypothetical protein PVAND_017392 [Polypedilum vanderplanki]|uniref:C2H2-type domain-containing protein n=1 Tax=Polypedilum vanderplanki TaxID=319348 RepID=A0A9J6BHY3_POLVA|nr:hypothetical protein PVAND_017392 [Polypedilum vanderplanki]
MSVSNVKIDADREFLLVLNDENQKNKSEKERKNFEVCSIWEKKLSSKNTLIQHMKQQHPNEISSKIYFCDHCPKKFLLKHRLISHLKLKHQKGKEIKFECDFDGKIFDSKAKIYYHMKACHRNKIKECEICGKKMKNLDQHMSQVHTTVDQKFQCQICNKNYKNQKTLKIHLKTHNKQHQCQTCGRKFSKLSEIKEHLKNHENQFAFRCEKCQKNFTSSSNLRKHLKTHNKNRIKNLKCNRCDYSTDNKHCLASHLKTHNEKREKSLRCNQCDYKTDHKGSLKRHLQTHNPKRMKFPCLFCNYEATERGCLKKHLKIHDPNRIKHLKCSHCKYATDDKRGFAYHLNAKHNKIQNI